MIFDGLENCLMAKGDDELAIDMTHKKLKHGRKKIKKKTKKAKIKRSMNL